MYVSCSYVCLCVRSCIFVCVCFWQTQVYLKDSWVPTLRSSIKTCLDAVSKGWYNMEESNSEVYQESKLKKLMNLIKFAMQVQ